MKEISRPLPWWRRRQLHVTLAISTAIIAVLVAADIIGYVLWPLRPASSAGQTPKPMAPQVQSVLPFTGLGNPSGVAVDSAGDVYVTDYSGGKVLKLAAGSNTQTELPFTDLQGPSGVAMDSVGNLYVIADTHRVVRLAVGSSAPIMLPFNAIPGPQGGSTFQGVTADSAGNLYVADTNQDRVLKLAAGSTTQSELSFPGINEAVPIGLAVDSAGALYITESKTRGRVLKLPAGASTPTVLPFTGLTFPNGVAVDRADNLYVVDSTNNRVLELASGSNTPTVLPFNGLHNPVGVAADGVGNLYVTDFFNGRVLKLPPG